MKSIIITNLVLAILFSGCLKSYNNTYIVINNTSKQVKIVGFAVEWSNLINQDSVYNEIIDIQPNSKFIITKGLGENSVPQGIFQIEEIDSVNVIFDGQKIIKYRCNSFDGVNICNDMRNIINYQEYYEKDCGEHECTYIYTITEADCESAEIIK